MKRSRSIRLALLGTVGLVGLAGCDDTPVASEGQFFRDASECRKVLDAASCESQFAAAKQEHVKSAPKFANKEQCEAQFGVGNCGTPEAIQGPTAGATTPATGTPAAGAAAPQQTAQSGGSGFFMPLMLGYLGGQMMSRMGQQPQPVYRDAKNTAYAGGSAGAGRSIGNWNPSSGGSVASAPGASTQRSGFGSTATRMSSGSGS
ncbi:uncharacterized protein YgiB involved in biofilm formation [Stella humosa]|uniref:Uncharacterized protein YgiB involved in biofilm formation n=1 Tax=Stella humosa TaxID=94 RepID=A0A3N1LPA1_9PROT|nr:DUF1190 domain-containing protein [Stella humosa]ROP91045.1 uncharacterized protein YgiB involved in biofilm formation [Stella humosa]BBK34605.1 hypothetical protein STHU_52390 [Stella humosa]